MEQAAGHPRNLGHSWQSPFQVELAYGIAAVSIWMGTLLTQRVRDIVAAAPDKLGHILDNAETPELTGHIIWNLYNDPNLMDVTGRTLIGAELATHYGITDEHGRQPPSCRDLHGVHPHPQFPRPLS